MAAIDLWGGTLLDTPLAAMGRSYCICLKAGKWIGQAGGSLRGNAELQLGNGPKAHE